MPQFVRRSLCLHKLTPRFVSSQTTTPQFTPQFVSSQTALLYKLHIFTNCSYSITEALELILPGSTCHRVVSRNQDLEGLPLLRLRK